MTFYNLPDTDAVIEYDKNLKMLYIAFNRAVIKDFQLSTGRGEFNIAETVSVHPFVNLDLDADGKILGIEVELP